VRALSTRLLRELGYAVTAAEDGEAAMAILQSEQPFDLLFTDAVMPGGMTGGELADAARRLRPGLKVLFTTGYARMQSKNGNDRFDAAPLIRKPYRRKELAEKIREALTTPG
jgi:two-component system, cell cycle sensor histidine kinase and response regulator CckA